MHNNLEDDVDDVNNNLKANIDDVHNNLEANVGYEHNNLEADVDYEHNNLEADVDDVVTSPVLQLCPLHIRQPHLPKKEKSILFLFYYLGYRYVICVYSINTGILCSFFIKIYTDIEKGTAFQIILLQKCCD